MSYLLDTNICIALLKGDDRPLVERIRAQSPSEIFLCSVVRGELLFGARKSQRIEANLKLLGGFFAQFESLPFDDRAADFYGKTRAQLTKSGTPVGANDLFIASIALSNELTVITRNRKEFQLISGLQTENW